MASDVPVIQEIAQRISYPDEGSLLQTELLHPAVDAPAAAVDAPAVWVKSKTLRDATGWHDNLSMRVIDGAKVSRHSLSSSPLTLGRVLRNQREELGLSRQELAFKLGIEAGHIAQFESDCGTRPSFPLLSRAANALGLDKDWLFQLAQTGVKSISGARKVVPHPKDNRQVFAAFARNRKLLDRHNVRPQELKALSRVSLMGKVTDTEALLFILDAIRKAGNTDQ
jgi:transcriptional regulator with XRE-family HTH domain